MAGMNTEGELVKHAQHMQQIKIITTAPTTLPITIPAMAPADRPLSLFAVAEVELIIVVVIVVVIVVFIAEINKILEHIA